MELSVTACAPHQPASPAFRLAHAIDWRLTSAEAAVAAARKRWIRVQESEAEWAFKPANAIDHPKMMSLTPKWLMSAKEVLDELVTSATITSPNDPVLLNILDENRSRPWICGLGFTTERDQTGNLNLLSRVC